MSFPFCFLTATALDQVRSFSAGELTVKLLNILGKSSWEIYTVHSVVLNLLGSFFLAYNAAFLSPGLRHTLTFIVVAASIPLAVLLNTAISKLQKTVAPES